MRLNYYRFPEGTEEKTLLENGCAIRLKNGTEMYAETISESKREMVDYIDDTIYGISVTRAKNLLKQYGGAAWTEHCDRDGSVFEVTNIELKGNNSKFKYNRHL